MQTSFKIKGRKPKINDFRKKFNRKGPGPWARGCGPKGFNAVLKGPNGPGGSDSYGGSSNHFRSNFESCSKQLRIISEVTSNHCRNNFESFLKQFRIISEVTSNHCRNKLESFLKQLRMISEATSKHFRSNFEQFSKQLRTILEATSNHFLQIHRFLPCRMTLACIALYRVLLYPIVLYVCLSFKSISFFHVKWPSIGPWWPQDRANIGSNRLKCIPRPPKSAPWNLEKKRSKTIVFLQPEWVGMARGSSESVATTIICDAG